MDLHQNARSCYQSRVLLVERVLMQGWKVKDAAAAAGLSESRTYHWLRRFREEGHDGLQDRSCRPHKSPTQTPERIRQQIIRLRWRRWTFYQIADRTGVSIATVSRLLRRIGWSRLRNLEPKPIVQRYERKQPGQLLHIDIKPLARIKGLGHRVTGRRVHSQGVGFENAHVCIDDASRVAYVEILANKKAETAAGFLQRAVAWFEQRGVYVESVMTDNGGCYLSRLFSVACRKLQIRHLRTRPFRPQTNGKAERLIQTLLREWAYRFPYQSSQQRAQQLHRYLHFYNFHRAHSSLKYQPPISRLNLNNVLISNI